MELRILGPLEVLRAGQPVDVRGSKRRALLALLILHANEVVRTDRLIDELWGDRLPSNASGALHNHVSRLRKDLGGELLVTRPWGYVLRVDPDTVDLHRFESLVGEAKALPARERRAKLAEALQLWHGPALAGLEHEPSLAVEIARLEDLRVTAVEQRIDADLELGAHEQLVPELEVLVGENPLRERLRGQLILALYRSGRQAEALETYRETRRVLVDELGIDPSPELRELEQAILRQDPALAIARMTAAPPPPETEPPLPRWRWPRSPLVIGVGLLLVAGGGAVAGVLETTGGTSHPSVPTSRSPAHLAAHGLPGFQPAAASSRSADTVPAAGTVPVWRSKRPVHRPAAQRPAGQPQKPKSTPSAGHVPPPPPPPPQPPPAKRKPPPPPPPPKFVYWLADNFHDSAFDHDLWDLETNGSGASVAERNDRLEFAIDPGAVPNDTGIDAHYGTNCLVEGDFEVIVQYQLLTWPAMDGMNIGLAAWVPPPNSEWLGVVRAGGRSDGAPEAYFTNLWEGTKASVPTLDTRGALRLRRKGGILSAYYHHGRSWIWMGSRRAPAAAVLILSFSTPGGSMFGDQAAAAAFDNFQATAESVECPPGVPLPQRKRRR